MSTEASDAPRESTAVPVKTEEQGTVPVRKHIHDAGADLTSSEETVIPAGGWTLVNTGVRVALPVGTVGYVTPRSGLAAKHGVTVLNAPGTVDAGYRGELKVVLVNHSDVDHVVGIGDRIAQLVIQEIFLPEFVEVDDLESLGETDRGSGGCGSTGR